MAHEDIALSRYTLPFWSRKRRFSALTLAGQAKAGVVPAASCTEELPEAVPSFPKVARPVQVPFSSGEPDAGVAANVGSNVAATITPRPNHVQKTEESSGHVTLRLRWEKSLIRNARIPPHQVDNGVACLDNHKRLFGVGLIGRNSKNVRAADGT